MEEKYQTSVKKIDNEEKIRGEAKFVDDINIECLYAKTLRSTIASGRVRNINIPKLPKGYYIVSKDDVPAFNVVNIIELDWPVFANGTVNYVGEPILLVVGKDKEIIDEILREIEVEYIENEPNFAFSEPVIHRHFTKGDYNKVKNNAKQIIKETFETGYQEQAYLEPQSILAYYEEDVLTIVASMQCPYYIHKAVKYCMGIKDDSKLRIIQPPTGGAFGGKEHFPSILGCQLAVALNKIKKPIKMIFERDEDICFTTKRHPSKVTIEAAIDENNKVVGLDIDVALDSGAYIGPTGVVLNRALIACTNAYTIDNLIVNGRAFKTNNIPTAAFRGFGSPQTIFAIEMFMDHVAKKLGVDPLEFKNNHMVKQGDITSTNGVFHDPIILDKMIDKAIEMSDYKNKYEKYSKEGCYRGIAMSRFLHGCGFTGDGEATIIKAKVKLVKDINNHVYMYCSAVDMGQGNKTTLRRIVVDTLKVDEDSVTFDNIDTKYALNSGPTAASRTILIIGYLFERCALKLKDGWKDNEHQEFIQEYEAPPYIKWDQDTLQGDAYPSYSWGVNVIEVEVSPLTYQVDIIGAWSVYDVGKVIDERIMIGQADGGLAQAIGYGCMEFLSIVNGKIRHRNLTDYIVPTAMDLPKMETCFMDNPFKYGPFGAKGAGELTFVGGAPAVALAIENAINKPIHAIPVSPERIMRLVEDED